MKITLLDSSLIIKWVKFGGTQSSKHNLVLTESAERGSSHEGPKQLGCLGRCDDHMEHKNGAQDLHGGEAGTLTRSLKKFSLE